MYPFITVRAVVLNNGVVVRVGQPNAVIGMRAAVVADQRVVVAARVGENDAVVAIQTGVVDERVVAGVVNVYAIVIVVRAIVVSHDVLAAQVVEDYALIDVDGACVVAERVVRRIEQKHAPTVFRAGIVVDHVRA